MNRLVFGTVGIVTAGVLTTLTMLAARKAAHLDSPDGSPYAYRSSSFDRLVIDSFHEFGETSTRPFYQSFEQAFRQVSGQSLDRTIAQTIEEIGRLKGGARVAAEVDFSRDMHRIVKRAIPKFSLDRGFEFYYTSTAGERQCFLQSVLIASLMQRVGMDAGVAMVYSNEHGELSNNGHAITYVRLPDGRGLVVDASEQTPFAKHRGLFVRWQAGGHKFVEPSYAAGSIPFITSLTISGTRKSFRPTLEMGLDIAFLRSQFDFYRGERTPGGFISQVVTRAGLERSERYLTRARMECSENPLVVCALGYVQEKLGNKQSALASYRAALNLYRTDGWTPVDLGDALIRLQSQLS